jgi:hypothetical protein
VQTTLLEKLKETLMDRKREEQMKWNVSHTEIENGINNVWSIKEIVNTFLWRYMDHPKPMTEDEVYNHIYSIECLIDLYCEKLMDTYCKVYELDEYASDEMKAYRDKIFSSQEVQEAITKVKKTKKVK